MSLVQIRLTTSHTQETNMLPAIPPSAPFIPHKYSNVFYVDPVNGLDTNDGSFENPFQTITKANTSTGGSGTLWLLAPGTYADAISITAPNLDICGFGARSGLVNITGTMTFAATAGSVRCANISHASLVFTTARPVYFRDCNMSSGTITKSGTGYVSAESCDWGTSTATNLSAGSTSFFNSNNAFVTNSGTSYTFFNSCGSCIAPIASGGVLDSVNSTIFASVNGGNGISSYGASSVTLSDTRIVQPSGYLAKISIQGQSYYMRNCQFEEADSVIGAASIGTPSVYNGLRLTAPPAIDLTSANNSLVGIDLSGKLSISPMTSVPIEALYKKVATQTISGGQNAIISFDTKLHDTHNAFNGTKFTAPRAGFLTIIVNAIWNQGNTANYIGIGKNNQATSLSYLGGTEMSSGVSSTNSVFRVQTAKNDTWDVRAYLGTTATSGTSNQFWVSFSLT